uniref:DNA-directed RNA polymerase I subunit rpa49 n=1 Tax=Syphacia muris TaxID=451379 RepID=A0A0N5AYM5_9BILA
MGTLQAGCDIVAHLKYCRVSKISKAKFKRYRPVTQSNSFVYSLDIHGINNDNIVCVGKEVEAQLGYDYLIAVVNRRTKLVDYIPVKFVKFANIFSRDPNIVLGLKPPPKVSYDVDIGSNESWAEKRRALTSEFGSAKKLKMQESALRRQIKDVCKFIVSLQFVPQETLKTMMDNSGLFSPITGEEGNVKAKAISMLATPESSVLPKANNEAAGPNDVYSFNLFFSEIEVNALKETSSQFWRVSSLLPDLLKKTTPSSDNAVFLLLLAAMCSCYKLIGKRSKNQISEAEWFSFSYPVQIMDKIKELFFSSGFQKNGKRRSSVSVNSIEKDKLLSHIICLSLLLYDHMQFPISPWAKELKCAEGRISKLAEALGCKVEKLSPSESVRLETINVARLVGPPMKSPKKKFTSRRGGR